MAHINFLSKLCRQLITAYSKLSSLILALNQKISLHEFKKLIKEFNSRMNASVDHQSSLHNNLGIYTSTYISKDGWPEVSKKTRY